jgi:UDP-N-acetyl-D-glucosamine dehydrogenase
VAFYDPHIPVIGPTREHAAWQSARSVAWSRATIARFDAVVIATAHRAVNYRELAKWAQLIVDTRNVLADCRLPASKLWKA